jgi:vesicle-fusing ATPase
MYHQVGFFKRNVQPTEAYDGDEMANTLVRSLSSVVFSQEQLILFDFHGQMIKAIVKGLSVVSVEGQRRSPYPPMGILMDSTAITIMKAGDSPIQIKGSSKRYVLLVLNFIEPLPNILSLTRAPPNAILAPNFKFEDMGIGGLDTEFAAIFRRAFASRVFPPGIVEKLGIQHVKGLLLYGPPGTGKTLMARQIGKMLNAREPKIVNGPEILDKFVGKSEENIRKLFADAEAEVFTLTLLIA